MFGIDDAILGGIGLLGGLFGNRPKTYTTTQHQTGQTNQTSDTYNQSNFYRKSLPQFTENQWDFRNNIIGNANALLGLPTPQRTSPEFLNAYSANALRNINSGIDASRNNLLANLRQRGLAGSSMGAYASMQGDQDRIRQINDVINNIPLLQRQINMEDDANINNILAQRLGSATGAFSAIPYGQEQEGYDYGHQTQLSELKSLMDSITRQQQPGNMLGGMFGSLGSILGGLWGLRGGGGSGSGYPS